MSQTNNQMIKVEQKYGKEQLATLGGTTYLPSVRLMAKTSELVAADKIKQGNYALVYSGKDKLDDLTNSFDCLVLVWRPFAMQQTDDGWESSYDPNSALFKEIEKNAEAKLHSAMNGPEFLVYVASAKKFAQFLFASKTAKGCVEDMLALQGKTATIKSQFIKKKKFSWWAPEIHACTTPFTLPTQDEVNEAVAKFNNPPTKVEHDPVEKKPGRVR